MNETLKTIAARYSCRKYTDEKPSQEQLEAIALAALQSPSGINRQPWRIYVVTNDSILADMETTAMDTARAMESQKIYEYYMERGGTMFYNAPCMFIVTAPKGSDMDSGIVSENIALAATSLGLGNVICGIASLCFNDKNGEHFKQRIGIPESERFSIAVLAGYAEEEIAAHEPDLSKVKYVK